MKTFFALCLASGFLVLAGCDSLPSGSGGRLGPAPATTRIFQGTSRAVYDAAKASLAKMEFRVTKGGPAAGRIEAVSGLKSDESLRSTRQITMSIHISDLGDGTCEVSAVLKEAIEEDSVERQGFVTQSTLRDTPYYEVFFSGLGQVLGIPEKG
jgi:hypothetical protein